MLAYIARRLGPIREIPIIMYLVSAMFDTLRNIDEFMETSMWKSCREYINRVRQAPRGGLAHRWRLLDGYRS